MANYLTDIVATHRAAAAADGRDLDGLLCDALVSPPPRPFAAALVAQAAHGLGMIAEVKRRSPSKGDLDPDLDPAEVARAYASGGATALSVLTDGPAFGGSPADLAAARDACPLPVLRKDFTVSRADVCDARIMGADAVLLIVAALSETELLEFLGLATVLGLAALVEVHDEAELELALGAGASLIGVNQRDLSTFEVDPERAARLAARIPDYAVAVAESGLRDGVDAARLAAAGYQAVLVGESVVRAADRSVAVKAMVGHRIGTRRAGGPVASP